ncbi:MAG TPA: FtsX-like permease family protein [Gemmataceae bacterium]|nr:FtsX-like permease family protein [Gemmataceae bacterium]
MPTVPPVPLAWKNLAHDKVRFGLFASGIGFAVVLMGVQLGIRNAMLDGYTFLIERINGDLVVMNPARSSLIFREGVSRHRLEQARNVPGVASVHPLYLDAQVGQLRNSAGGTTTPAGRDTGTGSAGDAPEGTQNRNIRVIGVDPDANLLLGIDPELMEKLRVPGTALFDLKSRPSATVKGQTVFGVGDLDKPFVTELNGRNITLVGGFRLGFDFSTDGTLIVSDRTFEQYMRAPFTSPLAEPLADADLGVVRLADGASADAVKAALKKAYDPFGDVVVLTREELAARERGFWLEATPIGFAFGAGVILGFVVGMVICYQILAGDVADHLPEYATLKAIGYPNRYLNMVVIQESLYLALVGYLLGIAVTLVAYLGLERLTGMEMKVTPGRLGLILVLTVVMCVASGMLAVSKVKKVDPADVF